MWDKNLARALAVALIALPCCRCGGEPSIELPRLVMLYATCTLNNRYLSPYNEQVTYTPNIERFAREAAIMASNQTESGVSGVAYASIFSGTQADQHSVFKHPTVLDDELYLIPEAFRDGGFDTFYWSKHAMTTPRLNYHQGTELENTFERRLSGRDEDFLAVIRRIRDDPNYRALIVASFTVTHGPYERSHFRKFAKRYPDEVPDLDPSRIDALHKIYTQNTFPLMTRFDETIADLGLSARDVDQLVAVVDSTYKSRVHFLDILFGGILDRLEEFGVLNDALIAFTADHGETLFREDRLFKWTHGPDLAPEIINTPLVIRGPGDLISPQTIDAVTRSIDLYPTLAGLAGVEIPDSAGVQGTDYSEALRGVEGFPQIRAFSHGTLRQWSFFTPDVIENIWVSLREEDRIYTWRRLDEAWRFDMQRVVDGIASPAEVLDPDEPQHAQVSKELLSYKSRLVEAYHEQNQKPARTKKEALERLDDEDRRALQGLGYIE